MATEITVIRHGETLWNHQKRIQGQGNSNLSKNGITQAQEVAKALEKRQFNILISSDLGRAIETANIINQKLFLPHLQNQNLRERSFGVAEGKTLNKIAQEYPSDFVRYKSRDPHHAFQGGESIAAMYNRVVAEINNIAEQYNEQNVLIVSHGLVLEMMMYRTFNLSLESPRVFSINNSSINKFTINNSNWFLKEWGVIEHLVSLNVLNEL